MKFNMFGNIDTLAIMVVFLCILCSLMFPLLTFFAINVIFGTNIPFNITNVFAFWLLYCVFRFNVNIKM